MVVQTSPVFNPLALPSDDKLQVTETVPLAVTQTNIRGTTTGYVYYLKTIDSTLRIVSWTIGRNGNTSDAVAPGIYKDTQLAACSINDQPHLYYQNAEGKLVQRNMTTHDSKSSLVLDFVYHRLIIWPAVEVRGIESMAPGGHFAVVAADDLVLIYFRSSDNIFRRIKQVSGHWEPAVDVSPFPIEADSSIALVPHTIDSGETMIHYFYWSQEEIIHGSESTTAG